MRIILDEILSIEIFSDDRSNYLDRLVLMKDLSPLLKLHLVELKKVDLAEKAPSTALMNTHTSSTCALGISSNFNFPVPDHDYNNDNIPWVRLSK